MMTTYLRRGGLCAFCHRAPAGRGSEYCSQSCARAHDVHFPVREVGDLAALMAARTRRR